MMKTDNLVRPYFRAFYERNRLRFCAAVILRLLLVPGMLVISWLLGAVVDVMNSGELPRLWRLLALAAAVIVIFMIVELGYHRIHSTFIHKALAQYKSLAFRRISEKSISAFTQENTGRYISVLTNDVNTIEEKYLSSFFELIAQPPQFLGTLVMMCWYSPMMTAAVVLLCLLPFAGMMVLNPEFARREKAVSDQNEDFVAKIKDLLAGFAIIKSFKAEHETKTIFDTENTALEEVKRRSSWWQGLLSTSGDLSLIMQFGIFFIGAYLAIHGDITAGTVLVFVNLCNSLVHPVQTVPQYWAARKAARGLVEKMAQITEENTAHTGEHIEPVLDEAVKLEHVTFGYEPGRPVLRDLSLRLEAGKKYAIVGGSGSGKSTLLNLLMGAFGGYEGSLTIDGKELRNIDPDSLYDLMSLIGQNVFLFDDTVQQNITMFRDFPAPQIEETVKRSGLSALIADKGTDYRCGENGNGLSGGERQRVSIARCLLRGTPVLLLDEATAALDNQTAFSVTDAILHLDGLTRVVVTHRLDAALMEQYDKIFILRDGHIQEEGTFSQLMEQKGYFYSLYTLAA